MRHRIQLIAALSAVVLVLVTAVSALGYSGQVKGSISIRAAVTCDGPITATATLLDADGAPIAGESVAWSFVESPSASDKIDKTPTITNAKGVASTTLSLAPVNGVRRIRATAGEGTESEVSATAVINPVCSGTLPSTSTMPADTRGGDTAALLAALAFIVGLALTIRRLAPTSR